MSGNGFFRRTAGSLRDGIFGRIFTSYDKIESARCGGAIFDVFSRIRTSRTALRIRRGIARSVEGSFIARAAGRLGSALPWMTLRSYGTFLFSLGFYTSIIYAIKAVATTLTADTDALVSGVMLMLLSVPLLLSGKTLAEAVLSSGLSSFLVFDILGFRRDEAEAGRSPHKRADMMFLVGMAMGLLTFYIEPYHIIGAFLSLVLLFVVMSKPESGVILLYALFPFFPDLQLSAIILITLVSYLVKLACGRRTLRFDTVDAFMLVFFLLIAAAELINYGAGTEYTGTPRRVIYMTAYFLTTNLMSNQAWRSRMIRALMFGGSAVAVVSIISVFSDPMTAAIAGTGSQSVAGLGAWFDSVICSAEESSYYLAMMLPVMAAYVFRRGNGKRRLNVLFFSIVTLTAAVLTMSRGIWLGAVAGIVLLLIICDPRFILLPAAAAVGVPAVIMLIPQDARAGVMTLFDMSGALTQDRVAVRRLSSMIFFDNFLGGIGRGDGVFYSVYNSYSSVGASADNSQNLFLEIGVELGVFGLLVFILATVFLLMKSFTGAKRAPDRARRICSVALACGLFAALISGLSSYIWLDERMFFLFFMFAGAASAYNDEMATDPGCEVIPGIVNGDGNTASIDIEYWEDV